MTIVTKASVASSLAQACLKQPSQGVISYCAGVAAETQDISDLVRTAVVLSSLRVTHGVIGVHVVVLKFTGGLKA
jgi:hypothetical protein